MIDPDQDDRPRHHKKAIKPSRKRFGIEQWSEWFKRWYHRQWYATAKSRDQAIEDLKRHTCNILKKYGHNPRYRKVDR